MYKLLYDSDSLTTSNPSGTVRGLVSLIWVSEGDEVGLRLYHRDFLCPTAIKICSHDKIERERDEWRRHRIETFYQNE